MTLQYGNKYGNSEEPHEMSHNAFLYCLLITKSIFTDRNTFFSEILTYDPSIYKMDHSDFHVYSFMEYSIGLQWVIIIPVSSPTQPWQLPRTKSYNKEGLWS